MKIEFERLGKHTVVRLEGRIGGEASVGMYQQIKAHVLDDSDRNVILDFSKVDFIDSSGLGSLVAINSTMLKMKRKLVLAAVPENMMQMLKITNLTVILEIAPTVEHAAK